MPTLILICKYNDLYWKEQKIVGEGEFNSVPRCSISSCVLFEGKTYRIVVCLFLFCSYLYKTKQPHHPFGQCGCDLSIKI